MSIIKRTEINKEKQNAIIKEEKKKKRKKISLLLFKIIGIITVLFLSIFLYLRYIATSGLIVKEYSLTYSNLPTSFNGLKVIHFSDLKYGSTTDSKTLKKVIDKINIINPDIVVFTGDLLDNEYKITDSEKENLIKELNRINSTIGKYRVTGDNDKENSEYILNNTDFIKLKNSYELLYYKGTIPILLIGLDSDINTSIAFQYFNEEQKLDNIFTIVLTHKPDNTKEILSQIKANIILSGHSLNGQVRLPLIGGIYYPEGSKSYKEEYLRVNETDLFISGGLGTNQYKFRLFNRPSINFYRIKNS